jgi:hypothetical protein
MGQTEVIDRAWQYDLDPDVARLRCSYRRRRKRIVQFTVQIEVFYAGHWRPVVRYDNAHGFCHRDTIHADGTQEKYPIYYGDMNATFTRAIDELRGNWPAHCARFLREIEE